ncbi:MAG: class I SAM-dependent methyltransferase [Proteobacteria bacterium]|nr:class I SAM-dependent methyltransferase [Pseudomonadota bacterium]
MKTIQIPDSIQYYDENAQNYFDTTICFDMRSLYDRFLPFIPKGGKILDAGCGSGRDSKYFLNQGYVVSAFDGSENMAKLASQLTGLTVQHKNFLDINSEEEFNGIWSSASLLHVPQPDLLKTLEKLKKALRYQGVWYMSFRFGEGERNEGDRYFNDQTEISLRNVLKQLGDFETIYMGISDSLRSRRGYQFVSTVVRKSK